MIELGDVFKLAMPYGHPARYQVVSLSLIQSSSSVEREVGIREHPGGFTYTGSLETLEDHLTSGYIVRDKLIREPVNTLMELFM
jgi:hypothetical protein